jgi:MtN3 and saliva related transmembrane protein
MDSLIAMLGFTAGTLTTLAFVPQVIKSWKSKSTQDVSLAMFLVLCTGILLWLTYGFLINDTPLIVANGFSLLLAGSILIMKFRFK